MAKKFPNMVYVTIQDEGTEDEYLSADKSLDNLVCVGEEIKVGTYKLIETGTAVGTVKLV